MITYALDRGTGEPLYEILYKKIRDDIQSGVFKGGMKLPSKRSFAQQLSVSIITVENAYAQLLTEGYIEAKERKGYYVSDISVLRRDSVKYDAEDEQKKVLMHIHNDQQSRNYFADFASNQSLPESFPFSVWAKVCREVLSDSQEELMTNAPPGGIAALREAIAEHLAQFRGMQVEPEQVIIGAGTEYLYGMLIQLFGFERYYACENPGYRKLSQVFEQYGLRHTAIPLDKEGISVVELEKTGADVVHVTPSHHFPTGITMKAGRRYELLQWSASGKGRYIIEDDYDSEFRMTGKPLPSLFGNDSMGRVIYMNTFTKSLASTIRVSYMVLPKTLLGQYWEKLSFYSCPVSTFDQYTLARFISKGYFEKHINRMRNVSRKKRNLLLESIVQSGLDRYADISEENAGLHFLMNIRPVHGMKVFWERLSQLGIHIYSLDHYMLREDDMLHAKQNEQNEKNIWDYEGAHSTLVMNYAALPEQRIPEAVHRICEAAGIDTEEGTTIL